MSDENRPLCEIKSFHEFLENCLGKKVSNYKLRPLTKPGDNYGSIMQALDVVVGGNEDTVLNLVTKTAATNPYLIELFQPAVTFVKEVHFYSDIIPSIEYFEQKSNVPDNEKIDAFIRCFGSRISLNSTSTLADSDAVVLLENIKILNYKNIDGSIGFNFHETQEIIKQLAKFHSICIAMRRQQPELFNSKIRPFLGAVNLIPDTDGTRQIDVVTKDLTFVHGLDQSLLTKIREQLELSFNFTIDTCLASDTPFTTVIHRDLWINNIMIRSDETSYRPIRTKFYDFQLYFYQSLAHDLIFFLLTSVRDSDLENHFRSFINHYHVEFIKTLKMVNCSQDDYTFEKVWLEIQRCAPMEMIHVLIMSKLPLIDKTTVSYDDITPDTFYQKGPPSKAILNRWKLILDLYVEHGFI